MSAAKPKRRAVASDHERYVLGTAFPREVVRPGTVEELSAYLRACNDERRSVTLFGGATLQSALAPPARYDVAIDLRALDALIAHEPRDLTVAVGAGMSVATLSARLAAHGQFLPLDVPLPREATVGGTLASGWAGPRRAAYGRPRDLLIGATAVLADGTIASTGGMVVKNSTGYDLGKLYTGSYGTIAAIVRANFKTLPLPAAQRLLVARLPERSAERVGDHIAGVEFEPAMALVVNGFDGETIGEDGADGRLILLLEGGAAAVDRATREMRAECGAAGVPETTVVDAGVREHVARICDAYVRARETRSLTYRSAGVPSTVLDRTMRFVEAGRACGCSIDTIADLRTGDAIARIAAPDQPSFALRAAGVDASVRERLGNVAILNAPQAVRGALESSLPPAPALAKMLAIKKRFDPNEILAPGRLFAGRDS